MLGWTEDFSVSVAKKCTNGERRRRRKRKSKRI